MLLHSASYENNMVLAAARIVAILVATIFSCNCVTH